MNPVKTDRQAARHALAVHQAKIQIERTRDLCLSYLDVSRPHPITDAALLDLIRDVYPATSLLELRRNLDFLELRGWLTKTVRGGTWHLKLTWQGVLEAEAQATYVFAA